MNLNKLFDLQRRLDSVIIKEHHLKDESLFSEKALALQVKLAELANKTRCFKYWSNEKSSANELIVEEYIDCLHFILSIGLDKNFNDIELSDVNTENNLTDQFLDLFIDTNDFIICSSLDTYITLFEDFLCLGENLGLSDDIIENTFLNENLVTSNRQASLY
ncbi:MAG: dUTP diphosphatase [Clostridium sp.]|nr:dUTP diphosphatase [Clostridium sp.]